MGSDPIGTLECKKKYGVLGDCVWRRWNTTVRLFHGEWSSPQDDGGIEDWVAVFKNPDVYDTIFKMKQLMKSATKSAFDSTNEEKIKEEIRSYTGCKLIEE